MSANDPRSDAEFLARAQRRRDSAWTRLIQREEADRDDPDEAVSTASERLALVDTLTLLSLRETNHGTEPRLQRSVARLLKRRR